MISIDEHPPPDPSSSDNQNHHHHQQEVSHEAFASVSDIDLLKPTDANLDDTNNPLPNFSIRDYVFGSRSKDITRNWPFSHKSLQLCLNYGVKNFLPPFQSLDSLKNYSSVSISAVENHSPNEETISSFDNKTRNDKSQCHLEEDLAHTKSNSQPTVKKCKLVMKLNSGIEPVEETMASRICPVCKTFSSSSNTTLNAHIDRCLSEESSMKWTANHKTKTVNRIKPRKTRLMVDIYKTAPHCTIEELDRRNGTNWANNSNFPDQEFELEAEEKKKEPQEPTFIPQAADHEDAVYIDKNGKKVWMLAMPKFCKLDDHQARILQKGKKGCKVVITKKKKKAYGQKNDRKILELSPNSKKLNKKVVDKQATIGQEENVAIEESCNKEKGCEKPMKAQVHKQMDDLAITRPPWACSKRTGVAKKRVLVLTKPKEGTPLDNIRSKESKFSSLKKNLVSACRERNAGSKFNFKRKFSSLKKSQDSLKQKSRIEEDTSKKMSFENVLKVKKMKSSTSKSSNEESSRELEITSESARTEDGIGHERNFMAWKNSLDNEFSKMISQLDNKSDPRERTLDIIIEHNTGKQGNYFDEVDPIPIPGPPGSFLPPSPGADMGSEEEPQGNSSLTTMSRVQSSEDHNHRNIMNQDFISGSPISTVSSPSFARSADKLSERFDKQSVNDNTTSDLRSVDAIFTEKGPTPSGFQTDHPCCCSRKESAVLRERTTESTGLRSELFSLVNHLISPPPETVKLPAVSPATPVLRLMGKNLTVVNTNDEQVKPPCSSPMGQYQQLQKIQNENRSSYFYGHGYGYPPQHQIIFSHNQNGSMHQHFNLHPPNNLRSVAGLRLANIDINAPKDIIVVDDSSENEGDDDHMFKERMIRNRAFTFANPYGNVSLQTSSPLREVGNDGNLGRWVSTAYYPHSFS